MTPLTIGSAKARPGRISYGSFDLLRHPVGGADSMPVIIAQGDPGGPVFWVTAGIHGPEHAGLLVIQRLITPQLAKNLHGTVVALPALNPAGLRTMQRQAYYYDGDPNRIFPDGKPPREADPDEDPPSALEVAYGRLFEDLKSSANYMVDLHNHATGSVSFCFRDRVLFRNEGSAEARKRERETARQVDVKLAEMADAYGHSVVFEMPTRQYMEHKLHRSTTAAAVNILRIPALTMELGTGHMPDPAIVQASAAGLRNIMRWAGMLPGEREEITGIPVVKTEFACRRRGAPRVSEACIIHHLCQPGDRISPGQPVAEVRDIWGRPIAEKVLESEYEGWVIARAHGVLFYPGADIYSLAIRDDLPTVQPYPKGFWK